MNLMTWWTAFFLTYASTYSYKSWPRVQAFELKPFINEIHCPMKNYSIPSLHGSFANAVESNRVKMKNEKLYIDLKEMKPYSWRESTSRVFGKINKRGKCHRNGKKAETANKNIFYKYNKYYGEDVRNYWCKPERRFLLGYNTVAFDPILFCQSNICRLRFSRCFEQIEFSGELFTSSFFFFWIAMKF